MNYVLGTAGNQGTHGTHNIPGPDGVAHAVNDASAYEETAEALCGETVHVWRGRHFPREDDNCADCISVAGLPPTLLQSND